MFKLTFIALLMLKTYMLFNQFKSGKAFFPGSKTLLNRTISNSRVVSGRGIQFSRVFNSAFVARNFLIGKVNQLFRTKFQLHQAMSMATSTTEVEKKPIEYFRLDYKPSPYTIPNVDLKFELDATNTIVTSTLSLVKQATNSNTCEDLVLDGEDIELLEVKLNDAVLSVSQYEIVGDKLRVPGSTIATVVNDATTFKLHTKVKLNPTKNLALSGLYKSGSSKLLCTQCEAMGFRRITYHFDRPDILSIYTVCLEADKTEFPLLLSNGNQVDQGDIAATNKHFVLWNDPFPKPSYLFALVAADLGSIHSTYTTTSGRVVQLGIYSDKENVAQLDHAMYSLKESMRWDEDTFGLECDLDIYNVVATNDFNMGAMENKGLNIFNSAYVLADPATATDTDYERILGVIGHEYFHNWSGNRVTVRDWFQLTLKEGLTVFRDQWFSSDMTSAAVKRIEDVRGLRGRQFAEDGGPLAHPIRPDSYISMDNFYTATVYSKGAEVVGLYRTLLGEDGFKKGLKLYFERFDGQAVTCDDFRNAMADANNVDLSQMDRWYSQAGTPRVDVAHAYDSATKTYTLTLSQSTPETPNQPSSNKLPLLMPITMGLLDPLTNQEVLPSTTLTFKEQTQTFTFENIPNKPVLSFLRGFSAPVNLQLEQSDEELIYLIGYDTDAFNKWDAANRYYTKLILSMAESSDVNGAVVPELFIDAIRQLLASVKTAGVDKSLIAYAIQLPDETTLMNQISTSATIDIDRLLNSRKHLKGVIAQALEAELNEVYELCSIGAAAFEFTPAEVGRRRLRNTCLDYLSTLKSTDASAATAIQRCKQQYDAATCMTEKIAAFGCLGGFNTAEERTQVINAFKTDAGNNALVLNKWFAIQAMADYPNVLADVMQLKQHPDFILSNPNRARALIGSFAGNLRHFHANDGSGYKFIADSIIELDQINPQVAARLVSVFATYKRFDEVRKGLMEAELKRILQQPKLSRDTLENVQRCLK